MSIRAKLTAQSLDQLITVQRKVVTPTSTGGSSVVWGTLVICRARVDGAKATSPEPVVDGAVQSLRDYIVWVRSEVVARHGVAPLDRVSWGGRKLSIRDVPDQGLRGQLVGLICRAGVTED